MPRETIFDEGELYDIQVGWMPDTYVQVGIKTHNGRSERWGTLDRAGINRLIRALKRARDQAYGADA